jgi:hypothetical protein
MGFEIPEISILKLSEISNPSDLGSIGFEIPEVKILKLSGILNPANLEWKPY